LSEEKQKESSTDEIKKSLDEVVQKLEQTPTSSDSWGSTMSDNREEWDQIKSKIHERQKALKALVREKKAGTIGSEEFDKQYRKLQDELTELEFKVYNLRLGTNIEI
jgi:chromosome segregation ATPase